MRIILELVYEQWKVSADWNSEAWPSREYVVTCYEMTCHEKNITTNRYLPIKPQHAMIKILMLLSLLRATHDAREWNVCTSLPSFPFIFISREYIFRYEFLRLHCPLIVSQWTKPCLSKWMDIYIYINEDKYMDTIYSSLMKEGYSYCCRQWRSYVLVTFTGCSNRWFTVSGVIRTVPVEISSFESVSNLL